MLQTATAFYSSDLTQSPQIIKNASSLLFVNCFTVLKIQKVSVLEELLSSKVRLLESFYFHKK